MSDTSRRVVDAIAVAVAAQLVTRTVWRPPGRFPGFAPLAYYVGHEDPLAPNQAVIWLNADHPELISPRRTHLGDATPLLVELLLAAADLKVHGATTLGLGATDPVKRRAAAFELADRITVITQFTPYPAVEDAEFARRAFAFAVIRQMTPGIGGVAPLERPAPSMPADDPLAVYAGRDADPRAPRGWGVIFLAPARERAAAFDAAYLRAFVLATADREPEGSAIRRAYDAAAREDASHRSSEARHAFAAPYVAQVQALSGP